MTHITKEKLKSLMQEYPKPSEIFMDYDAGGFRARANSLPWLMIRVGLLASFRSKIKQACVGVMITASHHLWFDNGVKIIDPQGEAPDPAWDFHVMEFAKLADDIDIIWNYVEELMTEYEIQPNDDAIIGIAYDTRKSSPLLANILKRAAQTLHTTILDFELMTTPQLHYSIRCYNDGFFGNYNEMGYYNKLCTAFQNLITSEMTPTLPEPVAVDCANGVGAVKLAYIYQELAEYIQMRIFNDGSAGRLNERCGADYIKVNQTVPLGMPINSYSKYCSIDGDADRLLYFFIDQNQQFRLIDSDRFSVLFAMFLSTKLKKARLPDETNIGVVQTAYANGSSTDYIKNQMKIPVTCVPTGTKNLHRQALVHDIGIYFEANGHGTVVFSDNFKREVKAASKDSERKVEERLAASQIFEFIRLINEIVGDGIANLLATEAVLFLLNLNLEKWLHLYEDLPTRQLKVNVTDQTMIRTTDAECHCVAPAQLQDRINEVIAKYPSGRAFVRPSATEHIVQVYAEATTQTDADKLADEIRLAVKELIK